MARANQVVGFTQHDDGTQTYTVAGAGSATFHPDLVFPDHRAKAELIGWNNRIKDKAALSRDSKSGHSATPQQKLAAIKAVIDHYESGAETWDMPRKAGGGGRTELSYVLEALANVQGLELDAMQTRVEEMAEKRGITVDAYLRKVATSERVATEIARIKHGASEDADDYLDELDAASAEEHDAQAEQDGMTPETEGETADESTETPNAG